LLILKKINFRVESREAINLAVLQLREEGVLDEIKTKWWVNRSECEQNVESKVQPKVQKTLIID
jgi:hypothetical protein